MDADDIILLIIRHFQGKLTEEDTRSLEEWAGENKERRELMEEFSHPSEVYEHIRLFAGFDTRKGWKKFRDKCFGRFLSNRFRYLKIAVIFFMCLGAGFCFFYDGGENELNEKAMSMAAIKPGMNQAVLILENGQEICLNETTQDIPTLPGGSWRVEEKGKLRYDSSGYESGEYHVLRVPQGGEYTIILEDGSQIQLNSDSELKYPVHFSRHQRKVLLSGQGYFKVAADGRRPFVVETAKMSVQVFGTSFDVMAYPEEDSFYTTLVEGNIEVCGKGVGAESLKVKPGWRVACQGGKCTMTEVDVNLYTAWIQGRFVFQSEELEQVLRKLTRWYNVEFMVRDDVIKRKRFTGSVARYGDITQILAMLELTTNIRFAVAGDKIVVEKK